jgi:hypothetical protein
LILTNKLRTLALAAPTNEAFAALPVETLESLLLPENIEQLQAILKYHALAGLYPISSLTSGAIETLNGDTVNITAVSGSGIMVNDAFVITADIRASNGIIHIIDKVLLPPADDAVTEEPANELAEAPADVDATLTTEGTVGSVIPESQGNYAGSTVEANLDEATDTMAAVSVDATISVASLENSGSSALAIPLSTMALHRCIVFCLLLMSF